MRVHYITAASGWGVLHERRGGGCRKQTQSIIYYNRDESEQPERGGTIPHDACHVPLGYRLYGAVLADDGSLTCWFASHTMMMMTKSLWSLVARRSGPVVQRKYCVYNYLNISFSPLSLSLGLSVSRRVFSESKRLGAAERLHETAAAAVVVVFRGRRLEKC